MHTDRGVGSRPSEWGLTGERAGVVGDSAASSGETGAKPSAIDLKSAPATGDPAPVVVDDAGAGVVASWAAKMDILMTPVRPGARFRWLLLWQGINS